MDHRSVADLVAAARLARERADGHGFCVATSLETELGLRAGGYKVANLPFEVSIELTVGRVLALTRGALFVSAHVEELFETSLYVAGPGGALDVYSFYCGPSGLALGAPTDRIDHHPFRAEEIASRWSAALAKVPPVDWCARAKSDFGTRIMGLRGGQPIGRHNPAGEPCRVPVIWDPGSFDRACSAAESAAGLEGEALARILVDLHEANLVAMRALDGGSEPRAIKERERRIAKVVKPSWLPAFEWAEAELAALPPGMPPSAILERAATILAFPQSTALLKAIGRERALALYERLRSCHRAMFGALAAVE